MTLTKTCPFKLSSAKWENSLEKAPVEYESLSNILSWALHWSSNVEPIKYDSSIVTKPLSPKISHSNFKNKQTSSLEIEALEL